MDAGPRLRVSTAQRGQVGSGSGMPPCPRQATVLQECWGVNPNSCLSLDLLISMGSKDGVCAPLWPKEDRTAETGWTQLPKVPSYGGDKGSGLWVQNQISVYKASGIDVSGDIGLPSPRRQQIKGKRQSAREVGGLATQIKGTGPSAFGVHPPEWTLMRRLGGRLRISLRQPHDVPCGPAAAASGWHQTSRDASLPLSMQWCVWTAAGAVGKGRVESRRHPAPLPQAPRDEQR